MHHQRLQPFIDYFCDASTSSIFIGTEELAAGAYKSLKNNGDSAFYQAYFCPVIMCYGLNH